MDLTPLSLPEEDMALLRAGRRDNMFLKASVHCLRTDHRFDVVVRNVSAGGLLADTPQMLTICDAVVITLRNIGDVPGRVIWAEGARFGVAFDVLIDPQDVRNPVAVRKARPPHVPQKPGRLLLP